MIVQQSTLYSVQISPDKPTNVTPSDVMKFLGICILGSVGLRNVRYYWNPVLGVPLIQETMTVNYFETIRRCIHFNDNNNCIPRGQPGHDKLYKLRPIVNHLQEKFMSIPMEEFISVDEQMCPTKTRHHLKQYMPDKPHKYGFKLFVLSGYAYNFEVYTGQENESKRKDGEPYLGASSNVVVRLTRDIPENSHHMTIIIHQFH